MFRYVRVCTRFLSMFRGWGYMPRAQGYNCEASCMYEDNPFCITFGERVPLSSWPFVVLSFLLPTSGGSVPIRYPSAHKHSCRCLLHWHRQFSLVPNRVSRKTCSRKRGNETRTHPRDARWTFIPVSCIVQELVLTQIPKNRGRKNENA